MTLLRRAAAALLVTALAGVGVAMAAVPAQAVSSYRYWSYWYAGPSASSWTYGPIGPAGHTVVDGAVEGWRFIVAAPNPSAPPPRHAASSAFNDICGGKARPAGQVRVALVVDFGTSSDAPPHESPPAGLTGTCVTVPEGSKGLKVLSDPDAHYQPRIEGGLICGLSGYPANECGVVVKQASPTPTPSPSKPKPTKSAAAPPPTRASSPTTSSGPTTSEGSGGPGTASPTTAPPSASPPGGSPSSSAPTPGPSDSGGAVVAVGPPPPTGGSGSGTPAGLLLGGALVVGVGAAAVLRNRSQQNHERGAA